MLTNLWFAEAAIGTATGSLPVASCKQREYCVNTQFVPCRGSQPSVCSHSSEEISQQLRQSRGADHSQQCKEIPWVLCSSATNSSTALGLSGLPESFSLIQSHRKETWHLTWISCCKNLKGKVLNYLIKKLCFLLLLFSTESFAFAVEKLQASELENRSIWVQIRQAVLRQSSK